MKIECIKYDPDSATQAAHVLHLLRQVHELAPEQEMQCIQGYARVLKSRGWGVILHLADAQSLRLQVMEIARKRHAAIQRKLGEHLHALPDSLQILPSCPSTPPTPPPSRYTQMFRFTLLGMKKPEPFDENELDQALQVIKEFVEDENGKPTTEKIEYLVGWTVVPPNMMGGGLDNFARHDALDGAGCRGEAAGSALFTSFSCEHAMKSVQ